MGGNNKSSQWYVNVENMPSRGTQVVNLKSQIRNTNDINMSSKMSLVANI